jgi:hypothetical protein
LPDKTSRDILRVGLLGIFRGIVELAINSAISRENRIAKHWYKGADKSLARPGRKQATATDFDVHIPYLLS